MTTQNSVNTGLSGQTGTGNFVGATSPTLVTPTIGAAIATSIQIGNTGLLDTNGNVLLAFSATTSAVNGFTFTNAATGNSPTLAASGSGTNISLILSGKGNLGVPIKGVTDASDASAGYVGELLSVTQSIGTTGQTNNAVRDTTSLTLTAGDWDVWGWFGIGGASSTTVSLAVGGLSTTSVTLPNDRAQTFFSSPTFSTTSSLRVTVPYIRVSVSSNTTIYLCTQITFATSTCGTGGAIYARRVR